MKLLRAIFDVIVAGINVLRCKEFWQDFFHYYSAEEISKRLGKSKHD